jgi:hypothetical protein
MKYRNAYLEFTVFALGPCLNGGVVVTTTRHLAKGGVLCFEKGLLNECFITIDCSVNWVLHMLHLFA